MSERLSAKLAIADVALVIADVASARHHCPDCTDTHCGTCYNDCIECQIDRKVSLTLYRIADALIKGETE